MAMTFSMHFVFLAKYILPVSFMAECYHNQF